jgi:hypothetical protein
MTHSISLRFGSDRFDRTSELPAEYNAGNRFFGKDVAAYLAEALSAEGLPADYMDEDWGWLVFSRRDASQHFEVAVYCLDDEIEAGASAAAEWGLWLRAHERRKLLGLMPRHVEVPVPAEVERAVRKAITDLGATALPWDDGR